MKNILKRTAAVLFAGMLMINGSVSAFAESAETEENKNDSIVLPSGMTLKEAMREITDEMKEECSEKLEDTSMGSASLVVFKGDEILTEGYYGYTDYDNQTAADENSVFEWGSISKTLIWVSAMQLWEQGKLDLERDVRDYLPEGFFQHLSYDDPITMINLMNHDAGWCETVRTIWFEDGETIPPLKEALQSIEPEQVTRPGERVAYSNYGAAVAGYVIECISGMDYGEYVRKNIFEPLGMEHTAISPDHSDNQWVYEQRRQMHSYDTQMRVTDMGNALYYVGAYPAGAATGTIGDLVTYAQGLLNDDAPLFENKSTQQALFEGTDFYGKSDIPVNAHGFFCNERGVRTYFHTGGTKFGQADMEFDLDSKFGVVVMHSEGLNGNWLMSNAPELIFGQLHPDVYGSPAGEYDFTDRYYLPSRPYYTGLLSFMPVLTAVQFSDKVEDIGSGVYQLRSKDGEMAAILGSKTTNDGTQLLEVTSADLVHDKFYVAKLMLFTLYYLAGIAGSYMLRLRLKLYKTHRDTGIAGSAINGIGQGARLLSVGAVFASYIIYYKYTGGMTVTSMRVIGILQMICCAVLTVSALCSAITLVAGKNKSVPVIVINSLNIIANAFCIGAILFFELYRFWGC